MSTVTEHYSSLLEQQYKDSGYEPHYDQIDAAVATESACDECGKHELRYIGLQMNNGERMVYRAISHCNNCGYEYEF